MKKYKKFLETVEFHRAKTWEGFAPHEYIIKNKLNEKQKKTFDNIMKYIKKHGYKKKFLKRWYTYFDFDGYRYWIDVAHGCIFILNRTETWREFL